MYVLNTARFFIKSRFYSYSLFFCNPQNTFSCLAELKQTDQTEYFTVLLTLWSVKWFYGQSQIWITVTNSFLKCAWNIE